MTPRSWVLFHDGEVRLKGKASSHWLKLPGHLLAIRGEAKDCGIFSELCHNLGIFQLEAVCGTKEEGQLRLGEKPYCTLSQSTVEDEKS